MFSFFGNRQRGFAVVGFGVNVGAVDQQVFHDGEVSVRGGFDQWELARTVAVVCVGAIFEQPDGDLLMAAGNRAGEGVIASAIRGYRG